MRRLDRRRAASHDAGRAQHIEELADVARPGVDLEHLDDGGRQGQTTVAAVLIQDAPHQCREIGAFTQRGQTHRQTVEAVVQIFPKGFFRNQFAQVAVGGTDDVHVHRNAALTAQWGDLPLLQHPQQSRLQGQGHVANFVQKKCAAVGLKNAAGLAPLARPGEGAFLIAEQFGLDEAFGDRGAVHGHKGLDAPRGIGMHGTGQQFLAHTGLPQDHQGNVLVQDALDLVDQGANLGVAGTQAFQGCMARRRCRRSHGRLRAGRRIALSHGREGRSRRRRRPGR